MSAAAKLAPEASERVLAALPRGDGRDELRICLSEFKGARFTQAIARQVARDVPLFKVVPLAGHALVVGRMLVPSVLDRQRLRVGGG